MNGWTNFKRVDFRFKKKAIFAVMLLGLVVAVLFIFGCKNTIAETIYVDDSGGQDYEKIQDAVDNTEEGDIIRVYEGIYYENVNIDKSLTLIGNGTENTTINGQGSGIYVVKMRVDYVNISEFTIRHSGLLAAGVEVHSSHNTISNCNISNNDLGIFLRDSSNSKISNCNISINFGRSIQLDFSSNNTISNCNISNFEGGISLFKSSNNIISNNTFLENGIKIEGSILSHFIHSIENNTVNGKPLLYFKNENDIILNGKKVGQIILANCSNFKIKNINISKTDVGLQIAYNNNNNISNNDFNGIRLWYSNNTTLSNCNVSDQYGTVIWYSEDNTISNISYGGLCLRYSNNNTISNYNISNNYYGILLEYSNENKVSNCNISNNDDDGIHLSHSSNNTISSCTISNNGRNSITLATSSNNTIFKCNISNNEWNGIRLLKSSNITISNCNISKNDDFGIHLSYSSKNKISSCNISNNSYGMYIESNSTDNILYHNNFINNSVNNTYDECSNQWDNDKEGNYWDDYDGEDNDGNGIGDTPYNISGGDNQDRYPLIYLLGTNDTTPPEIINVTDYPDSQQKSGNVNITCNVTDNVEVNVVKVNITYPDNSTVNETMSEGSYYYNTTYSMLGTYDYFIWANDTSNNSNTSKSYSFNITDTTPPEITNITVSNITNNSVMISWKTDENSTTLVKYGLNESYGNNTSNDTLVKIHKITLTGLESNATYHFCVNSTDEHNNMNESIDYNFTTEKEPDNTPPEIYNVTNSSITHNSVTITWETDEPSTSLIKYGLNESYGNETSNKTLVKIHKITLTGLESNTTYHFGVNSTDESNNTNQSIDFNFTTKADITPPEIYNVTNSSITHNSVTITWETDEPSTSLVKYGMNESYGNNTSNDTLVKFHNITLTELKSNTTYHFCVNSTDESNNTNESIDFNFATKADITPPEIYNVTNSSITHNSVTITWETDEPSTSLVKYGLDVTYGNEISNDTLVKFHNITLTELKSNTTYHFCVNSTDDSNNTNESIDFNFTTKADITPPEIYNVKNSTPTHNSVTITWETDEKSTSLVKYGLNESYGNNTSNNTLVKFHNITLTGLESETTYHFCVNSTDGSNNTNESIDFNFTTKADITPPEIYNVTNSSITHNSVTITWETDEPSTSLVKYGLDETYGNNNSNDTLVKFHNITLTELKSNTTYHFCVNSTDENNNTNESIDFNFTTKADITPPEIYNVTNSSITHDSVTITWETDEPSTSLVKYGLNESYGNNNSNDNLVKFHNIILTGLESNTTYHFCVNSTDESNNTNESIDFNFTTKKPGLQIVTNAPEELESDEVVDITITITNITMQPVDGVNVTIQVTGSGGSNISDGKTNQTGELTFKLIADNATYEDKNITIWINATKEDYENSSFKVIIIVKASMMHKLIIITNAPEELESEESKEVTITVTGSGPVKDAHVYIYTNYGGNTNISEGYTNENGELKFLLTADETNEDFEFTLNIDASKDGYEDDHYEKEITVKAAIVTPTNYVSGNITDSNDEPIEDIAILLWDIDDGEVAGFITLTNNLGYYEIEAYDGNFILVINIILEDKNNYETNLSKFSLIEGESKNINVKLGALKKDIYDISIILSDWNNGEINEEAIIGESSWWRFFMIDINADGDGIVDKSEIDELIKNIKEFEDDEEYFFVDDILFFELNDTITVTIDNAEGNVTDDLGELKLKYNAEIEANNTVQEIDTHIIKAKFDYDSDNSTFIYNITLPSGFELDTHDAPSDVEVTITGNIITVDPKKPEKWKKNITINFTIKKVKIQITEPKEITLGNGAKVTIIAAIEGDGEITVKEIENPDPNDTTGIGIYIDIELIDGDPENLVWLNITINYKDLPENIKAEDLKIYFWDDANKKWIRTDNTGVDIANKIVWANVTHLTIFAPRVESVPDTGGEDGGGPNAILFGIPIAIIVVVVILFVIKPKLIGSKKEEEVKAKERKIEKKIVQEKYEEGEEVGWHEKGVESFRVGKLEEAIISFEKAIEFDPGYEKAWFNKGLIQNKLGRYDEALECFTKATEVYPEYTKAWYNKGTILQKLYRYEESIECYEKALELDPEFEKAEEAIDICNEKLEMEGQLPEDAKGKIKLAKGLEIALDFDGALAIYKELDMEDEIKRVKMEKAKGYLSSHALEKALEIYEEIEAVEDIKRIKAMIAREFEAKNDFENAIKIYEEIEAIEDIKRIRKMKAVELESIDRINEALEIYREIDSIDDIKRIKTMQAKELESLDEFEAAIMVYEEIDAFEEIKRIKIMLADEFEGNEEFENAAQLYIEIKMFEEARRVRLNARKPPEERIKPKWKVTEEPKVEEPEIKEEEEIPQEEVVEEEVAKEEKEVEELPEPEEKIEKEIQEELYKEETQIEAEEKLEIKEDTKLRIMSPKERKKAEKEAKKLIKLKKGKKKKEKVKKEKKKKIKKKKKEKVQKVEDETSEMKEEVFSIEEKVDEDIDIWKPKEKKEDIPEVFKPTEEIEEMGLTEDIPLKKGKKEKVEIPEEDIDM